jgi:hypothetical protein
MKYGPNSEQVEAYLEQVARIDAEGWASAAQALESSPGLVEHASKVIDMARSRATRNGLRSEVDAAARAARHALDAVLEARPTGPVSDAELVLLGDDEPVHCAAAGGAAMDALVAAATSGATLLVLRPLLTDVEFSQAWPMRVIDPRRLPSHVVVPPMGAVG